MAYNHPDTVALYFAAWTLGAAVAPINISEDDPRITYLCNEQNLGITANYDRCRDLASAGLMMFLGCDDLLLPDLPSVVLSPENAGRARHGQTVHTTDPAVVLAGPVRLLDEAARLIGIAEVTPWRRAS